MFWTTKLESIAQISNLDSFMPLELENIKNKDPFTGDEFDDEFNEQNDIHLRIQPRGRKVLTTCQGIPEDLDLKKILQAIKKVFLFLIYVN